MVDIDKIVVKFNEDKGFLYYPVTNAFYSLEAKDAEKLYNLVESFKESKLCPEEMLALKQKMDGMLVKDKSNRNFQDGLLGERKDIETLTVVVYNKCNLNCAYCYADGGDYGKDVTKLSIDDFKRYMDALLDLGIESIRFVSFFGGEPLMNYKVIGDICLLMQKLYEENRITALPEYSLITNGTLVNEEIIEVIKTWNIRITVSIDGSKEINDICRVDRNGNGTYEKVIEDLDRFKENHITPYMIEATYNRCHEEHGYTREDVKDFLQKQVGVEKILVAECSGELAPCNLPTDLKSNLYSNRCDMDDNLFKCLTVLKGNQIATGYTCTAGVKNYIMDSNGDIYPCHHFLKEIRFLLAKYDRDEERYIVSDEYQRHRLLDEYSNKYAAKQCKDCWIKDFCSRCTWLTVQSSEEENVFWCEEKRDTVTKLLLELCT